MHVCDDSDSLKSSSLFCVHIITTYLCVMRLCSHDYLQLCAIPARLAPILDLGLSSVDLGCYFSVTVRYDETVIVVGLTA